MLNANHLFQIRSFERKSLIVVTCFIFGIEAWISDEYDSALCALIRYKFTAKRAYLCLKTGVFHDPEDGSGGVTSKMPQTANKMY